MYISLLFLITLFNLKKSLKEREILVVIIKILFHFLTSFQFTLLTLCLHILI